MRMADIHLRGDEQVLRLKSGLLVIEGLAMGERDGWIQNMDGTGHVGMNQADQLVVAGSWEGHRERLSLDHWWRTNAG